MSFQKGNQKERRNAQRAQAGIPLLSSVPPLPETSNTFLVWCISQPYTMIVVSLVNMRLLASIQLHITFIFSINTEFWLSFGCRLITLEINTWSNKEFGPTTVIPPTESETNHSFWVGWGLLGSAFCTFVLDSGGTVGRDLVLPATLKNTPLVYEHTYWISITT